MQVIDTIPLVEVIQWMDSGQDFSLSFVTYDKKRKRGGEWIEVKSACKHIRRTIRKANGKTELVPLSDDHRDPNHFSHSTRNIKFPNGEIRKVHLRLIRVFNQKTVL